MDGRDRRSIGEYLEDLASAAPAPGGGSAVAIAGALGAALVEMVCNVTLGRSVDTSLATELRVARDTAAILRQRLQDLATDDASAYAAYVAATGLPRTSETERAARRAATQAALHTAASVPTAIAEAGIEVLIVLDSTVTYGSRYVLSDTEVAALLADAAVSGAVANIRVNARLMNDREAAETFVKRANDLAARSKSLSRAAIERARHRMNTS